MPDHKCCCEPEEIEVWGGCTCAPYASLTNDSPTWGEWGIAILEWPLLHLALLILVLWGAKAGLDWIDPPKMWLCEPNTACVRVNQADYPHLVNQFDRSDRYDPFARDFR
jgi:hypothetical protein